MSIQKKILLWLLIPFIILATTATTFYYFNSRKPLEQNIFGQLETSADALHEQIHIFLEAKKGRALDFSSDGFIRDVTEKISMKECGVEYYTSALNNHLIVNKKSLDPDIREILVIDFEDRVVASTDEEHIGKAVSTREMFSEEMFSDVFVGEPYFDSRSGEFLVDFAAVLLNKVGREPIGFIINRVKFEQGVSIQDGKSAIQDIENHHPEFVVANKIRIIDFSSDGFIRDYTEEIVRREERVFYYADLLNTHLSANKQPLDPDILSVFVLDLDGRVISSTEIGLIGRDVSDEAYFQKTVENGSWIDDLRYPQGLRQNTFFHVAKLIMSNRKEGLPTGMIVNTYSGDYFGKITYSDIKNRLEIARQQEGLGKTGELYIVNSDKLMITGSRFIKDAVFHQVVNTQGVMGAFENRRGFTGIYPDYRGIPVLGVTRYFEELDWVILAEKDVSEAFVSLHHLRNFTVIIGCTGIIILAVVAVFVSRGITKPIKKLVKHTHKIAEGDLTEEIRIKSQDELGSLARSFDAMRQELQKRVKHLQKLSELGLRALEDPDINNLMDETAVLIAQTLEVEYCKISELLPDGKVLLLKAGVGWEQGYVRHLTEAVRADSQGGYTLLSEKPVIVEDIHTETRFRASHLLLGHGIVSGMSIIIKGKDSPFGVLCVYTAGRRTFTINDVHFLQSVANLITEAVERKRLSSYIDRVARYDILTNLPNRVLFIDRVTGAILRAKRQRTQFAVLCLNLDRFKVVNDNVGNEAGNRLLQSVSERLVNCVREGDTVSRLWGDEFAVISGGIASMADVTKVLHRVKRAVSQPYMLNDREIYITASIGISIYPQDNGGAEALITKAGAAMRQAKEHGKNVDRFYNPDMETTSHELMGLENDLHKALDGEEFLLYYQPQVEINTNRIIGAEALVRWNHPHRGLVSPSEFIPVAENTGMIVPIGEWVLHTALAQNKAWQEGGLHRIKVSVNFSAVQFRQKDPVEIIKHALRETGLDPKYMELEITESVIMKKADVVIDKFHELKEIGIYICMDDFGTGYSSLSYLNRFPIDTLKIDQSFARNVTTNANNASIVTAIIAMAHSLGIKTIAEGVETEDQLEFFRSLKCEVIQGFLFSKPLPAEEITKLLRKGKLHPS